MISQTKADRLASALATLIREQGIAVTSNSARLRGILKDELSGDLGPQIDLLSRALDAGIVKEIVDARGMPGGDPAPLRNRLAEIVGPDDAAWVLDVWLRALNVAPGATLLQQTRPAALTGLLEATRVRVPIAGRSVPVTALAAVFVLVVAVAALAFSAHGPKPNPNAGKVVATVTSAAHAASAADLDDAGVARISYVQGDVAIKRGDEPSETLAAALNAPLFAGDQVGTGNGAAAEAHLASDWLIRMNDQTEVHFEDLQPGSRQLQLARGDVELRIFGHADNGPPQVDTPSIEIVPQQVGAYRVSVTGDGRTVLTVRSGQAEIVLPQGNQTVQAGQTVIATGPATDPHIESGSVVASDGFDTFNQQRDAHDAAIITAQMTPVTDGVAELNAYGRWVDTSAYGRVWVPRQSAEWTPYSDGRWVWEDGYGWTWVDDAPWGWAPYHYGRWVDDPSAGGWAWVAGPPAPWSPALVAFISAPGIVAWIPLGPHEPYYPWYGPGGAATAIVTANVNVLATYRAAGYARAVRWISRDRFERGAFGRYAFVRPADLHRYAVVRGALPVVPTRADLAYSARRVVAPHFAAAHGFAGPAYTPHRVAFASARGSAAAALRHPTHAVAAARFAPGRAGGASNARTPGHVAAGHIAPAHVAHYAAHAPAGSVAHYRTATHPQRARPATAYAAQRHTPSTAYNGARARTVNGATRVNSAYARTPGTAYGRQRPVYGGYNQPRAPGSAYGGQRPAYGGYSRPRPPGSTYGQQRPVYNGGYNQPRPPGSTYGQPVPPGSTYGQPRPPGSVYGRPVYPGYNQARPPVYNQQRPVFRPRAFPTPHH